MPVSIEDVLAELVRDGLVSDPSSLTNSGKLGDRAFECDLPIPHPNEEELPERTRVRVRIPVQFPLSKVEFVLLDPSLRGFAHQEILTGALCLKPQNEYPPGASARMRAYVESAVEWLTHAADGSLLAPGERWELPDFRVKRSDEPPVLLPVEDERTFEVWSGRIGQAGVAQLCLHVHGKVPGPVRFARGSETVLEPPVNRGFLDASKSILAPWVLLPSHIVERHRCAQTFLELEALCRAVGVDLWTLVHRATKATPLTGYHYILVGAPIPNIVGEPAKQVHWQPIVLGKLDHTRDGARSRERRRDRTRSVLREGGIPWGEAVTYPESRSEARGSLSSATKGAKICVLGIGALGSSVAEHLARGGVRDLALFDNQALELENLSRHTLGPQEVGKSKAIALARRLNGIHPGAYVRGFALNLPPGTPTREQKIGWDILHRADVLVDCTTNESAFRWASHLGRAGGKQVIHMFINAHARMLTLCSSGRHASCLRVADGLFADIDDGTAGFTKEEYDGDGEVHPGAGCWQSTFPALGSDIAALVASTTPIIDRVVSQDRPSRGTAVVLRRNELSNESSSLVDALPKAIVEVAWAREYR